MEKEESDWHLQHDGGDPLTSQVLVLVDEWHKFHPLLHPINQCCANRNRAWMLYCSLVQISSTLITCCLLREVTDMWVIGGMVIAYDTAYELLVSMLTNNQPTQI